MIREAPPGDLETITPGLYDFRPSFCPKRKGGRYRVLGIGTHAHSRQKLVAYVGEGGADDGEMFFCTISDFAMKFMRVPNPPQASPGLAEVGRHFDSPHM